MFWEENQMGKKGREKRKGMGRGEGTGGGIGGVREEVRVG